jgi:hypothetical protein
MIMDRAFYGSLTRIADLGEWPLPVEPRDRSTWDNGDYAVVEVLDVSFPAERLELTDGREVELTVGDWLIGALGSRAATLEATGSWREVGEDLTLYSLSGAGLLGQLTSKSVLSPHLAKVRYVGHVMVDGRPSNMRDWVVPVPERAICSPVILVIGTSMSAGKTLSARRVIRQLRGLGRTVVGAKLTGAGRWRDVLSMRDAGAHAIFDFVDVGLPSTIVEEAVFREANRQLLSRIAGAEGDVIVAEAGASPLEPYNGGIAVEMLEGSTAFVLLCASDPYAARGIMEAFGVQPDLVAGPAANTRAGVALVESLCGVPALNLLTPESGPLLRAMLVELLEGARSGVEVGFR